MAKAGDVFKKILVKTGKYKAETHDPIIESMNVAELDDEESNIIVNSLLTRQEAKTVLHEQIELEVGAKYKGIGKAEAFDGLDKGTLKEFEPLLDEANLAKYREIKSTPEKAKFMLTHLQSRSVGAGDAIAYKKALEELRTKIDSDYVPKSNLSELETRLKNLQTTAYKKELLALAATNNKISQTKKSEKRFQDNLVLDIEDVLNEKGWAYDLETGKVTTKGENATTVLTDDDKPLQISHVLDLVLEANPDYIKVSEEPANLGVVSVQTNAPVTSKSTQSNQRLRESAARLPE